VFFFLSKGSFFCKKKESLRTATQTFRKGLIQKLRIEWAKNTFSFLVKVLSFVKRKKV